jgi:hypothetical protein
VCGRDDGATEIFIDAMPEHKIFLPEVALELFATTSKAAAFGVAAFRDIQCEWIEVDSLALMRAISRNELATAGSQAKKFVATMYRAPQLDETNRNQTSNAKSSRSSSIAF